MKVHLLFVLALALMGLMGTVGAQGDAGDVYVGETRVNTIENLFTYANAPDAEDKLAGAAGDAVPTEHPLNAAYRAELCRYIRAEQHEAVSGGLRFRALRSLAVNSLCVLEWSVENVSDEPLRLEAGHMEVNGGCGDVRRAVSSGRVLQPGERVLCVAADSRFDRQGEELFDYRLILTVADAAADLCEIHAEHIQQYELCAVGLGCRYGDLRAGPCVEHIVGLSGYGAADNIDDGEDPGAETPGLAQRGHGVEGFAGLAYNDDKAAGAYKRVGIAELREKEVVGRI